MYILPDSTLSALKTHIEPLTTREALSGILGACCMSCWLFLLLPQLVENYHNQSGEAISLAFVVIWFLGDVTNLLGGLWADLVSTVIAIAIYFCFIDVTLISQCLYYGIRNRRREGKTWLAATRESVSGELNTEAAVAVAQVQREQQQVQHNREEEDSGEEQPLLKRTMSASAPSGRRRRSVATLPGSGRPLSPAERRSSMDSQMRHRRRSSAANNPLSKILEERDSATGARLWMTNIISVLAVFAVGTVGWILAYQSGAWRPAPVEDDGSDDKPLAKGAQILGYISAAAYLGARIPQIIKNWREQSCEGLSLLFFILSLCGNLTYGASIIAHSTDKAYIIKNTPWLIGSLGTMFEDAVIFAQFRIYGDKSNNEVAVG